MSGAHSESDDEQYADETIAIDDTVAADDATAADDTFIDAPRGSWEGSSDVTSAPH